MCNCTTPAPELKQHVTPAEAAKLLSVAKLTVYNWIKSGKLPAVRLGGKTLRIELDALHEFMQPARD